MKTPKFSTSWLLAIVVFWVPLALVTLFLGGLASDRFASTTVISVKDTGGSGGSGAGGVAALAGLASGASYSDVFFLRSYLRSSDLLERVEAKLKLREHFSRSQADLLYRLSPDASREEFLEYFRNRVEITHDDLTGLVTLKVQGFEAAYAQTLAQALVAESDRFVNDSAHRLAHERMGFSEVEVVRAEEQVKKAKAALLAFQTKHKILDGNVQTASANSVVSALQANLAKLEGDLKTAQAFMSEESMQVRGLRSQILAIQSQLEAERRRSTEGQGGVQLPAQAMEYQGLLTQVGFAEEGRKAAMAAQDLARMDTTRRLKAVVVVEPPTLPDEAAYPRRLYHWFTALVLLTLLYAVVRLIAATIREHQD